LLLGGGRALLMQLAHPLVAAGVAEHTEFQRQPLLRLWRTLNLMLTIVFADAAGALRAVQAIERIHRRVRGVLDRDVGIFPRGTAYDAGDPRLLFWVHATLFDTALLVYERFVQPLPRATRRAFYRESKITARLFGVPERLIPKDLDEFDGYMREMITGGTLAVGSDGREVARSILTPPLPPGLKHAFQATNLFTIGLLPPPLRDSYGFTWGRAREAMIDAVSTATGTVLPLIPAPLRALPRLWR
jgi:uncharacterized protein (DUF2236 family)